MYLFICKKFKDKIIQVIFFLLVFVFLIDAYSVIQLLFLKQANFILNNTLLFFETLTLYFIFSKILLNNLVKKIIYTLAILFSLGWVVSFAYIRLHAYFDFCSNFENISILLLALYYYYEQVVSISTPFIYKEPYFWIVSAYFIYSAGVFFLFLYIPSLSIDESGKFYWLNYVFTIIRSLLLSIAMFSKPVKNTFNTGFNVRPKNFS